MSAPACRACGSPHVVLRGRKTGEFIRREFEFYQCRECELTFVEPFSGFEIYNDAYYRGHGPDPYVDYETEYRDWRRSDRGLEFDDMARIAERRLQDHGMTGLRDGNPAGSPVVPSSRGPAAAAGPLRWLDFGCGSGAFLKYLRERGSFLGRPLEISGHDVGSYAEMLGTKDGFRILDLDALSAEPAERYDVISMIEVIEHLPTPVEPLALVTRLLKPGGLLLLTTGNLDSPVARRQGIHYRYCAPEIHVSLFNPRCLAQLYRRVGLEPYPVRYQGAVKFKVVKSLRHRRVLRALASGALSLPPIVRAVDALYGVSAMPCAVKPADRR
jgi:SAM-dependent methyltransferase